MIPPQPTNYRELDDLKRHLTHLTRASMLARVWLGAAVVPPYLLTEDRKTASVQTELDQRARAARELQKNVDETLEHGERVVQALKKFGTID